MAAKLAILAAAAFAGMSAAHENGNNGRGVESLAADVAERGLGYSCAHDAYLSDTAHHKPVIGHQQYKDGGRRLTGSTYAPVRIKPVYLNIGTGANMTDTRATFLTTKLIPSAIGRWESMLLTVPVNGPLFAHRQCAAYWETGQGQAYLCNAFATSTGCANTPDDVGIVFNSTFFGADTTYTSRAEPVVVPAGPGLADADFGLFVTAEQTPRCGTGSGAGVLAYALSCQRDQWDRPTWGRVNFCPTNMDPSADRWDAQLGVAVHELAHALGFSASSWPLFRDSANGMVPRTPRDVRYPETPADAYMTPAYDYGACGSDVSWFFPANTTVDYFTERGMSCKMSAPGTGDPGFPGSNAPPMVSASDCVHKMTGPKVTAAARYFFDCPTLNGAELENQLTSACDLQGSHWEQRILSTELMSSYTGHVMKVSPLTLAAFEDSGWYVANYSNADKWRPGQDWGYRQGCSFATDKCLDSNMDGAGNPPHFFGESRGIGSMSGNAVCTIDRLAVGYVSISTYLSPLPSQFQYWSTAPSQGGAPPTTFDYCPAIQAYNNRLCTSASNQYAAASWFGETYGAGSSCFESSLIRTSRSGGGNGAGCYTSTCVRNFTGGNVWTMVVHLVGGEGVNADVTCSRKGQVIAGISGFSGSLTCPDPTAACDDGYTWDGESMDIVPRPSSSPSPTPSSSSTPTPSSAPAPLLLTIPFAFSGINISTALALNPATGLPPAAGSPFIQALLADACNATGTCGYGSATPLLYVHRAVDAGSGMEARFAFDATTGLSYLTSMTYPSMRRLTGGSTPSVTVTLAYRATGAAPSPAPGSPPNPTGFVALNASMVADREAIITARLAAITAGGDAAVQSSFQHLMDAYCSAAAITSNCASAVAAIVTTATSAAVQDTAFPAGPAARPSPSPAAVSGTTGSGASSSSSDGLPIPLIAGGAAAVLVLIIFIVVISYCCCCRQNDRKDMEAMNAVVFSGPRSSNSGPVGRGRQSGNMVVRSPRSADPESYASPAHRNANPMGVSVQYPSQPQSQQHMEYQGRGGRSNPYAGSLV